jgi:hypothetical protein
MKAESSNTFQLKPLLAKTTGSTILSPVKEEDHANAGIATTFNDDTTNSDEEIFDFKKGKSTIQSL